MSVFYSELCVPRAVHFCNTETNCSGHREKKREGSWRWTVFTLFLLFFYFSMFSLVCRQSPSACHPSKVTEQRSAQLASESEWGWEDRNYLFHERIGIQVLQTAVCPWQWRVLGNKFHPVSSLVLPPTISSQTSIRAFEVTKGKACFHLLPTFSYPKS